MRIPCPRKADGQSALNVSLNVRGRLTCNGELTVSGSSGSGSDAVFVTAQLGGQGEQLGLPVQPCDWDEKGP